jgi:hypothetical protein
VSAVVPRGRWRGELIGVRASHPAHFASEHRPLSRLLLHGKAPQPRPRARRRRRALRPAGTPPHAPAGRARMACAPLVR